jgi:hypothetical protein
LKKTKIKGKKRAKRKRRKKAKKRSETEKQDSEEEEPEQMQIDPETHGLCLTVKALKKIEVRIKWLDGDQEEFDIPFKLVDQEIFEVGEKKEYQTTYKQLDGKQNVGFIVIAIDRETYDQKSRKVLELIGFRYDACLQCS